MCWKDPWRPQQQNGRMPDTNAMILNENLFFSLNWIQYKIEIDPWELSTESIKSVRKVTQIKN